METDKTQDATTKSTNFINCVPKLVHVQYPGFVKNVDKALETLGGIRCIESVTAGEKKHLELSFRPKNLCSKPVLSNRDTQPQVLLTVRTKKAVQNGKVVSKEIVDYNVVGLTAVNITFTKLCDYQYLPLVSNTPKEVEDELVYIYNKIMPKNIMDQDCFCNDDADEHMPLYLVPYQFSKPHMHGNYLQFERSKFYEGQFDEEYCKKFQEAQQKITRRDGDKFTKATMLIRIEDDIPQQPNAQAVSMLEYRGVNNEVFERLKGLFDERPIWSRNALMYHSRASFDQMKYMLPALAFHYVSGPWRIMWVRFGYDARTDPRARMWQTFDYRIRNRGLSKTKTKSKGRATQANSIMPAPAKFSLANAAAAVVPVRSPKSVAVEEQSFLLKPGVMPTWRQTYFQYCNVKLPEIEAMLAKLPAVLPGTVYDVKHGWLPSGFSDQCREIVNKYIAELVVRKRQECQARTAAADHATSENSSSSSSSDSSDSEMSDGDDDRETGTKDIIDLEIAKEVRQFLGNNGSSAADGN